jgi:hypothetical protein
MTIDELIVGGDILAELLLIDMRKDSSISLLVTEVTKQQKSFGKQ